MDAALRAWIDARFPRAPSDRAFRATLTGSARELADIGTDRRKKRSDPIYLRYDELIAEADANFAMSELMMVRTEEAHQEADRRGLDDYAFAIEAPILDIDSRETGYQMLIRMRSVRNSEQMRRLRQVWNLRRGEPVVRSSLFAWSNAEGGAQYDPAFCERRVAIYEGVSRMTEAGPDPRPPFMIEALAAGVLANPEVLSVGLIEKRRRFLARTGVGPQLKRALGEPSVFSAKDRRWESLSLDMLHEVLVPTVPLHRMISTGRLSYRLAAATGVRSGTLLQVLDEPSGWEIVTLGDNDEQESVAGFTAIPKKRRAKVTFPIGDAGIIAAIGRHVELTLALDCDHVERPAEERDKLFVVNPPKGWAICFPPGRYLFQQNGRPMQSGQVCSAMKMTLMRDVVMQDVRDANAAVRGDDGADPEEVGYALVQSGRRMPGRYMKRGKLAEAAMTGIDFLKRRDDIARLGVGSAGRRR